MTGGHGEENRIDAGTQGRGDAEKRFFFHRRVFLSSRHGVNLYIEAGERN